MSDYTPTAIQLAIAYRLAKAHGHAWATRLPLEAHAGKTLGAIAAATAQAENTGDETIAGILSPQVVDSCDHPEAEWAGVYCLWHRTGTGRLAWSIDEDGSTELVVCRPGDEPGAGTLRASYVPEEDSTIGLSYKGPGRATDKLGDYCTRHLVTLRTAMEAVVPGSSDRIYPEMRRMASIGNAREARSLVAKAYADIGRAAVLVWETSLGRAGQYEFEPWLDTSMFADTLQAIADLYAGPERPTLQAIDGGKMRT